MSMPKGYVLLTETIHDPEGMKAYAKASGPSLAEHKVSVLAVDDGEVVEGEWPGSRTVLLEFESVEDARAWYTSAEYQAAKPLRQAAADCNAVILSGFEAPPRS
jgi:uncharacterized protein (DUF1330 family)